MLFIFILSTQLAFADMCEYVYKYNFQKINSPDIASIKKLNTYDNLTHKLKKFTSRGVDAETEILKGNANFAITKWSSLFRKVESSALYINNYKILNKSIQKGINLNVKDYEVFLKELKLPQYLIDQHLPFLYQNGPEKYLPILMKKMKKQLKVLGNNFNTYKQVRSSLDSLVKSKACSPKCQQSIAEVYSTIGITAKPERSIFKHLVQNKKSIKLSTVEKVFNSHPQSLIIAKRKEFLNQSVKVIKKIYNNTRLMKSVFSYLGSVSAAKGLKISRLFKRLYDKRAFTVHNKILTKVSYSDLAIKEKLSILKSESSAMDFNAILADMSRNSDIKIKDTFLELLSFSKKSNKRANLLKQLEEAQILGKKLGSMSKKKPRALGALITALVVSGAGIGYFTFDMETEGEIGQEGDDSSDGVIEFLDDSNDFEQLPTRNTEDSDDDIIILKFGSVADDQVFNELEEVVDTLSPFIAKISP
jgi:hypothetical protein